MCGRGSALVRRLGGLPRWPPRRKSWGRDAEIFKIGWNTTIPHKTGDQAGQRRRGLDAVTALTGQPKESFGHRVEADHGRLVRDEGP